MDYMNMRNHLKSITEGNEKVLNLIKRYQVELYKVMNDDDKRLDVIGDALIDIYSTLKKEGYELEDNTPYQSDKDNPVKRIQEDILAMAEQCGCKEAILNSGLLLQLKEDLELYESNKVKKYLSILGNM